MYAIAIVILVLVAALGTCCGFAAAVCAGLLLRSMHVEVAPVAVLVRRYGVAGAARWLVRHALGRWSGPGRSLLLCLVAVLFAGVAAGVSAPTVMWFALPRALTDGEGMLRAYGVLALVGGVVGVVVWWRGLTFLVRPRLSKRSAALDLTRLPVRARRGRTRLLINMYWQRQLGIAAFFGAAYPWLLLVLIAPSISSHGAAHPPDPGAAHPPDPHSFQSAPVFNMLIGVVIAAPSLAPALLLMEWLDRRLRAVNAAIAILEYLYPAGDARRQELSARMPPDPSNPRRTRLSTIARHLAGAACRLDQKQPTGLRPHPTAVLLPGVADRIRVHLAGVGSLEGGPDEELARALRLTVGVLAEPADPGDYRRLADLVDAFDADGNPRERLAAATAGRAERLVGRISDGIERTGRTVKAVTGIAVVIIAVFLLALGRLGLTAVLPHLK